MSDPKDFASGSDYDLLQREIDDKAFMRSRSDITSYYQDTYGQDWKKHIVDDILKNNPELKRASVQRQFQYDSRTGQERYKGEKQTAATKAKYQALGKNLPPKGKQATAHFTGYVYYSGKAFPKNFTRTLSESQTREMLNGSYWPVMEEYGLNMNDIEGIETTSIDIWF